MDMDDARDSSPALDSLSGGMNTEQAGGPAAAPLAADRGHGPGRRRTTLAVVVSIVVIGGAAGTAIAIHAGRSAANGPGTIAEAQASTAATTGATAVASARAGASPIPWQVVSLSSGGSSLSAVACVSSTDCWAVGGTTIEQYTASAWTVVSNPAPSGGSLNGVACASADDCWAVGGVYVPGNGSSQALLIERYSGTSWTMASGLAVTPETGGGGAPQLSGVTCISSDDCWAVGIDGAQPLIANYSGGEWTAVSNPDMASGGGSLDSVACATATECWAVGVAGDDETLIEQYSGSGWAVVTSPPVPGTDPGHNFPSLVAVTCADSEECWAVGNTGVGDYPVEGGFVTEQPVIEEYTGGSWSVVTSPHISSPNGALLAGVACVSSNDCWAVGTTQGDLWDLVGTPPPSTIPPQIEHYSGNGWTVANGPQIAGGGWLSATACLPAGSCVAVGAMGGDTVLGALTETTS
jgi:hypothetical protein